MGGAKLSHLAIRMHNLRLGLPGLRLLHGAICGLLRQPSQACHGSRGASGGRAAVSREASSRHPPVPRRGRGSHRLSGPERALRGCRPPREHGSGFRACSRTRTWIMSRRRRRLLAAALPCRRSQVGGGVDTPATSMLSPGGSRIRSPSRRMRVEMSPSSLRQWCAIVPASAFTTN
jgi:hypothetical protein